MTVERSHQPIAKPTRDRPRRQVIGKQLQSVFDALPAHIAVLDADATILAVNVAWRRFAQAHGYAGADHGVGANYLEICQQACGTDARAAEQAIRVVMAREQTEYSYEYSCLGPGQERWFLFRAARFAGNGPICMIVSHEDITHYKEIEDRSRLLEAAHRLAHQQAEQALGETRGHQQALFDHRNHAERLNILHEIDQTILSAGSLETIAQAVIRVIYRLIPYQRGSIIVFDFDLGEFQIAAVCQNGLLLETPARRFLIAENAEVATILPALRRGEPYVYDLRQLVASWPEAAALLAGGMRYQICTPLIAQGELFGSVQLVSATQEFFDSAYMPIIREILASLAIGVRQARLFEQVRAERERRHELARQLVAAQEQERRQLARELHDQIGQNLAVLNMNLMITRNQLSHESTQRADRRLAEAIQLVDQTVEQIRNVMAELRPAILDDFGLVAALRWYMRHFARHTDLAVLLEVEEPHAAPRLPADLETALFRIAQEALTNVLKHAHARLATLTLTVADQTIRLTIGDDGVGFNPSASRRKTQRWSLGLMTMQERVEAVGGRLVIDSVLGQGTRIIAEVAR
jgi:signal transduction histidine kinase